MMKWHKKGKIFNPMDHRMAGDFVGFAQSPQTLVFPDFVRIYFSTRRRDPLNQKFLSYVQYVDMDKNLEKIIGVSEHEVLGLGAAGNFDEHGIFPINVVPYKDKVYGFTTGWTRRVSVSADSGIGLVISHDQGRTFERFGCGPVMAANLKEPFLVADAFVQVHDNHFHMWYIYGTEWKLSEGAAAPDRVYKIAYAHSENAVDWVRDGALIIPDRHKDECQALPTVLKVGNRHHMYFCYRQAFDFRKNKDNGYRIGYAWSNDMLNWNRDDDAAGIGLGVEAGDWDSDMMCYPHIFKVDEKVFLLYNGNEFGKYGFGAAELVSD